MANHGYLPRNGVVNMLTGSSMFGKVFGKSFYHLKDCSLIDKRDGRRAVTYISALRNSFVRRCSVGLQRGILDLLT